MSIDDKEASSFKVVDRRAAHGGEEERKEAPEKQESLGEKKARPALSFSLFVQSLAHQAMLGLGLAPWPDSGLIRVELDLAKEMIDILLILQKKCAGNLDKDETALLDTLVYQLQVAYLEMAKKPADGSVLIK